MQDDLSQIIQNIHDSPEQIELCVTGGGTSVIGQLLSVAGASATLLNACVPYSNTALEAYIGGSVASACSELTARALGSCAFLNARKLGAGKLLGVGATAALQTNRQRRGSDRIYVAIQSQTSLTTYCLELDSSDLRSEQEHQCATFIILCVAKAAGVLLNSNIQALSGRPELVAVMAPVNHQEAEVAWQDLFVGDIKSTASAAYQGVFPGAFNPPHEGHFRIRELAEAKLGGSVAFELSIHNVDKPPLDYIDMAHRASQIQQQPLIFTRAATFIEKSSIFSNVAFVVGVDTITRIDDVKYYGGSIESRNAAIAAIAGHGNRFLVFGREVNGEFLELEDVSLTPQLMALCESVSEEEFRIDISSTELRQ